MEQKQSTTQAQIDILLSKVKALDVHIQNNTELIAHYNDDSALKSAERDYLNEKIQQLIDNIKD